MKKLLFFAALFCVYFSNSAGAQDVGIVGKNVYKLLADTLNIKMYEVTFKPGEKVAYHSHPDHTVYVLEGGSLEVTHTNGTKELISLSAGMAVIFPSEAHSARNPGKKRVKAIVTEINRPRS